MASEERERLRERIRAVGLRCTAARLAVLEVLVGASAPVSHPELVDRLGPDGWDRATLYRNLTDLAEAGLLRRLDHGDHVWRYELTGTHDGQHPHFVCVSCGEVACIPEVTVALPPGTLAPRSVQGGRVQVQLQGECDACAEAS